MSVPFNVFLSLVILLATSNLFAQPADICGCDSSLRDGIFSHRGLKNDNSAKEFVEQEFTKMSYDEFKKSAAGDLAIGYKQIFNLDASASEIDFQKKQDEIKKRNINWKQNNSTEDLLEKFGDRNVLGAWSDCKKSCVAEGPQIWYTPREEKTLEVKLRYLQKSGIPFLKVASSTISHGKVTNQPDLKIGQVLKKGKKIDKGEITLFIERNNKNAAITVSIITDTIGNDFNLYIPPFISIPNNQFAQQDPKIRFQLVSGPDGDCRSRKLVLRDNKLNQQLNVDVKAESDLVSNCA